MPATMTRPIFITPKQFAEEAGVARRTVYRWIEQGDLKATRLGGSVLISEKALAEAIGEEEAREVFDRYAE